MAWTLVYDDRLGILELVTSGAIGHEEMIETGIAVTQYQAKFGRLFTLLDATDANYEVPLVYLYDQPAKDFIELGANPLNMLAVIPPRSPKGRRDAEFFVDACINRGWNVQLFDTREEAITWLTNNQNDA